MSSNPPGAPKLDSVSATPVDMTAAAGDTKLEKKPSDGAETPQLSVAAVASNASAETSRARRERLPSGGGGGTSSDSGRPERERERERERDRERVAISGNDRQRLTRKLVFELKG